MWRCHVAMRTSTLLCPQRLYPAHRGWLTVCTHAGPWVARRVARNPASAVTSRPLCLKIWRSVLTLAALSLILSRHRPLAWPLSLCPLDPMFCHKQPLTHPPLPPSTVPQAHPASHWGHSPCPPGDRPSPPSGRNPWSLEVQRSGHLALCPSIVQASAGLPISTFSPILAHQL